MKKKQVEFDCIAVFLILLFCFYADQQVSWCSLNDDYERRNRGLCSEFLAVNQDNDQESPPWNLVSDSVEYNSVASGTANASLSAVVNMGRPTVI